VSGKSPGRSQSARSQSARVRGDDERRVRRSGRDDNSGADDDSPGDADEQRSDPESVARLICLRQLTTAPRTRAQLAATLRRRGVPQDAANAVLGRFAEVGLIDDAMFADAWVESRHHGRGLGRRALAAELNQRGVERGDIQAAVAKLSPATELATARALVERRLDSTTGRPVQVRVRRLAGMLARKGYPPGMAYRVVREALEQADQDQAGEGLDEDEFIDAELSAGEAD
jgi:regulatory protein